MSKVIKKQAKNKTKQQKYKQYNDKTDRKVSNGWTKAQSPHVMQRPLFL